MLSVVVVLAVCVLNVALCQAALPRNVTVYMTSRPQLLVLWNEEGLPDYVFEGIRKRSCLPSCALRVAWPDRNRTIPQLEREDRGMRPPPDCGTQSLRTHRRSPQSTRRRCPSPFASECRTQVGCPLWSAALHLAGTEATAAVARRNIASPGPGRRPSCLSRMRSSALQRLSISCSIIVDRCFLTTNADAHVRRYAGSITVFNWTAIGKGWP